MPGICRSVHELRPLILGPLTLEVMPDTRDDLILGCPMLEMFGWDIYAGLTHCARWKIKRRTKPMESENYIVYWRMSLSVAAMKEQPKSDGQVPDQGVERVVEHGSDIIMEAVIQETRQRMALEQTVIAATRSGLDPTPVAR